MNARLTDSAVNDRLEEAVSGHDALERAAEVVQPLLSAALDRLPATVNSVLHGQVFGHPLHPILVHLPLGGWVIAGVLDFVPLPSLQSPSLQSPGADDHGAQGDGAQGQAQAADLALLLGTVGASSAIATGWADWANTRGEARRTGLVHGLVNESAFLLNIASLWARHKGHRRLGKALSGTALLLGAAGGFLGGQLVYHHGLGVHRTLATVQG